MCFCLHSDVHLSVEMIYKSELRFIFEINFANEYNIFEHDLCVDFRCYLTHNARWQFVTMLNMLVEHKLNLKCFIFHIDTRGERAHHCRVLPARRPLSVISPHRDVGDKWSAACLILINLSIVYSLHMCMAFYVLINSRLFLI